MSITSSASFHIPGEGGARIAFLAAFAVIFTLAAFASAGWAVIAVLLAVVACAYYRGWIRAAVYEDIGDALVVPGTPVRMDWNAVESVRYHLPPESKGRVRKPRGSVSVFYAGTRIVLPAGDDREALLARIWEKSGLAGRPGTLPENIRCEYGEALEKFDATKVFATSGDTNDAIRPKGPRWVIGTMLVIFSISLVGKFSKGGTGSDEAIGGLVGIFLGYGIVIFILSRALMKNRPSRLNAGLGLLVTPEGLFLEGGKSAGKLDWKDLLHIEPLETRTFFSGGAPGIRLRLRGADLMIRDAYRHPLHLIHERISGQYDAYRLAAGTSVPPVAAPAPFVATPPPLPVAPPAVPEKPADDDDLL